MDSNYEALVEVIKEKMGIDFSEKIDYLKRKIEPKIKKDNTSIVQMMTALKRDKKYLQEIIELLTINETYFFREKEQLEAYKNVLKKMKTNNKKIKIWSCACSTGEEPYTLSFIAKEVLGDDADFEIIATDIDESVLDFAQKGEYKTSSLSFRRMDDRQKRKYFDEEKNGLRIKKEYKEKIKFEHFNLVEKNRWIMMKNFDIIFCRNVLIYFDDETVKEVNKNFYHSLKEEGYLFLGHADPHRDIYENFNVVTNEDTTYMVKGGSDCD